MKGPLNPEVQSLPRKHVVENQTERMQTEQRDDVLEGIVTALALDFPSAGAMCCNMHPVHRTLRAPFRPVKCTIRRTLRCLDVGGFVLHFVNSSPKKT